jgi:hypothetical protein
MIYLSIMVKHHKYSTIRPLIPPAPGTNRMHEQLAAAQEVRIRCLIVAYAGKGSTSVDITD